MNKGYSHYQVKYLNTSTGEVEFMDANVFKIMLKNQYTAVHVKSYELADFGLTKDDLSKAVYDMIRQQINKELWNLDF